MAIGGGRGGGESCSIHGRPDVTSRYEVLGHAGSGAYADVYRRRRRSNGAAVALKEVHDAVSAQREADALLAVASESSPHVVALLDHFPGSDQDDDVLVLEWLPLDLAAFVRHGRRAGGSLPWRRSRRLDQAMDAAGDQRHRRLPPCRRRASRPQARKPAHLGGRGAQGHRLWSDVQKGLSSKGASTCGAWNYCSEIDWPGYFRLQEQLTKICTNMGNVLEWSHGFQIKEQCYRGQMRNSHLMNRKYLLLRSQSLTAADYLHEIDQLHAKSTQGDVDKMSLQDGNTSCLATCSTGDIDDEPFRASYSYDLEDMGEEEESGAFTSFVGTWWFRAPELLYGSTNYGQEIDLWSLGCILAELLNLEPTFPGTSDIDQIGRIISILGNITEESFPGCSNLPDYNKIFFKKIEKPIGLEECLPNRSASEVTIIKRILCYDPAKRASAFDLMNDPYFTEEPLPVPTEGLQLPASKNEDNDSFAEEWGNYKYDNSDSDFDEFGSMDVTKTDKGFSVRFS